MRKFKDKLFGRHDTQTEPTAAGSAGSPPPVVTETVAVTFPDGIDVLYDPGEHGAQTSVDICFVHGLTGNRSTTWTADGQQQPWPQLLLPPKLPNARILTFGYDAYVIRKSVASNDRLIDHATNLLTDLVNNRSQGDAPRRPIIFVAHSLGGLVCKQAILLSRNNPESHLKSVFNLTKAVMFMGTPHTGSWMADWTKIPAASLGILKSTNKSLLKILQTDNQLLEAIQIGFLAMIRDLREGDRHLHVTCFFEGLPFPVVGSVVSKDSATFPGYNSISIRANHSDMVKFASSSDNGFTRVLGELTRWEAEVSNRNQPQQSHTHKETVSFETELLDDPRPEEDSDTDDSIATAFSILKIPCTQDADDSRARSAFSKYLELTEQAGVLEAMVELRKTNRKDALDKRMELESQFKQTYARAKSRCLKSLAFPEMGVREANIEPPLAGTCKWIYKDATYNDWSSQVNTLLWIKGTPGSGKSTLMKSLLERRKSTKKDPANLQPLVAQLSFFFSARGAAIEKTPIGLYLTLMHTLLRQMPLVACDFLSRFLEKENGSQNGKVSWQLTELANFFHEVVGQRHSSTIEIMIDALDECKEEEVRTVIRKFEHSIAAARESGAKLRVYWSSRYYPNISLQSEHGFNLRLDQENKWDIRHYVERELPKDAQKLYPTIREELITRANGVFLWVVLVSERLAKAVDQGKDEGQLKSLLNSIPGKLDDLFDEIFGNIDISTGKRQELLRIAQLILCSFRPLTLGEFLTAVALLTADEHFAFDDLDESTKAYSQLRKQIIDCSGGLFEVVGATNRVQVIHESVREFFLGPKGLGLLRVPSRDDFMLLGHAQLALSCFRGLSTKEFAAAMPYHDDVAASSTAEVLHSLSIPWQAPDSMFLHTYVQDFAFEHFDLARDQFMDTQSSDHLFNTTKERRRVLLGFLRLCCSHIAESQALRPGFSAHVQKVYAQAEAFGVDKAELTRLLVFVNNLSACSAVLSSCRIYMYEDPRPSQEVDDDRFIALFYVHDPSTYQHARKMETPHETAAPHNMELRGTEWRIRFVFALAFATTGRSDPATTLKGLLSQSSGDFLSDPAAFPLVIKDWVITDDVAHLEKLGDFASGLTNFPVANFHEYRHPTAMCEVFYLPVNAQVSAPQPRLGTTGLPLPKGGWWRPSKYGRERDMFEADTDVSSEEEDNGDQGLPQSSEKTAQQDNLFDLLYGTSSESDLDSLFGPSAGPDSQ